MYASRAAHGSSNTSRAAALEHLDRRGRAGGRGRRAAAPASLVPPRLAAGRAAAVLLPAPDAVGARPRAHAHARPRASAGPRRAARASVQHVDAVAGRLVGERVGEGAVGPAVVVAERLAVGGDDDGRAVGRRRRAPAARGPGSTGRSARRRGRARGRRRRTRCRSSRRRRGGTSGAGRRCATEPSLDVDPVVRRRAGRTAGGLARRQDRRPHALLDERPRARRRRPRSRAATSPSPAGRSGAAKSASPQRTCVRMSRSLASGRIRWLYAWAMAPPPARVGVDHPVDGPRGGARPATTAASDRR